MGETFTAADDRRHKPGPEKDWSESYWFGFYDPISQLGHVSRIATLANRGTCDVWYGLTHNGKLVHDGNALGLPLPTGDIENLSAGGMTIQCTEPLKGFRLLYKHQDIEMDVLWQASTPIYNLLGKKFPGAWNIHVEQAATVEGYAKIRGQTIRVARGMGYRDHTVGEHKWGTYGRWFWIVGQQESDLAFNCVKHTFPGSEAKHNGFLFSKGDIVKTWITRCEVQTKSNDTQPKACHIQFHERESGKEYDVHGRVVADYFVDYPEARINDAIAEFTIDGKKAYGFLEFGFQR